MKKSVHIQRIGTAALGIVFVSLAFCVSVVGAETITSPSYKINSNFGGSFGGQSSSTSYKMSAIGGEAIVGSGSSGSYVIDQQQSSASAQTMQLSVQPNGLVAYYPLDENTGTATADASRYQNNGTSSGTAAWYPGKLGSSLDMNSNGTVTVSDNSNLPIGSAMTMSAWVKESAWANNDAAIVSQWTYPGAPGWAIQSGANNNLRVFIASSSSDTGQNYIDTDTNTWNVFGTWRHVVMVYDGSASASSRVKVYIDSALVGSTVYGTIPTTLQNSSSPLSIGSFPGLGRYMNGAIDHVKIFDRALSTAEIGAEYSAQNAGVPTGVTLGTLTGNSTTSLVDAVVRTDAVTYGLSVQQDHDLQSGANTIPPVTGTIASPGTWTENVTEGLGFTVTGSPTTDGKWGSGSKYAAFPGVATTFYNEAAHSSSVVDVVNVRMRLDINGAQPLGAYANNIVYTGTTLP